MGISGLLPLLKSIQKPCSLKKFSGQTIGVDAYGWLHRGTVGCAIELALGNPTTKFVDFAMNRVRMLIHFGVTPYIVFDGDYLPSKAATESDRAKRREESKRVGLELYRLGKTSQAHQELQKAVDVTPQMARQLIEELKRTGVRYVVAPYEADAQLAYLERKGIIHGIISEDSDLLVFGAKCLLTKLDQYGECIEINRRNFTACREVSLIGWSDTDFRRMAILSGCDYLASINKMGLKTAYRLVRKHKSIDRILRSIQFDGQYRVPSGYLEAFQQAELTFLHQRVFCPITESLVFNTDPDRDVKVEDLHFIGEHVEASIAVGVARGDLHPMTKEVIIVECRRTKSSLVSARKQTSKVASDDPKTGKSIESFFKSTRTPLAELDPNSFTPSPSQQRLLQRNTGSWPSRPASSVPSLSTANVSLPATDPPVPRPSSRLQQQEADRSLRASISAARPPKRPRLCSDSTPDLITTSEKIETGRSRFFSSPAPNPSPSNWTAMKGRKSRKPAINIWSDDSVEDIMADLPDISDCLETSGKGKGKIAIFEEREGGDVEKIDISRSISANTSQTTVSTINSQKSDLSASVETPASSTTSMPATSTASPVISAHVSADLEALKEEYSYAIPSASVEASSIQVRDSSVAPALLKSGTSVVSRRVLLRKNSKQAATLRAVGQATMTPLQKLGVGAFDRGPFSSTPKGQVATKVQQTVPEVRESTPISEPLDELFQDPPEPVIEATIIKGSEDFMVPDSEEDSSAMSGSDGGQGRKPVLDLGRFAFTSR
ncbi:MAG: Rad2 nuclease [Pycnora praestabilis]|nr:MAG: Rad2 nuclease [Pycnora praestabilis]